MKLRCTSSLVFQWLPVAGRRQLLPDVQPQQVSAGASCRTVTGFWRNTGDKTAEADIARSDDPKVVHWLITAVEKVGSVAETFRRESGS